MDIKPRIIGLAGTNGSGKDTVGKILADHYGFLFISVSNILRNELDERGLEVSRENLRNLSAEWRRESGHLGVLVDKAMAEYDKNTSQHNGVVIASLRNPGEADRVHDFGGQVIWVDADEQLRYDRIQANAVSRQRQSEDNKTFEQFKAEEAAEMNKPAEGDDASLNILAVKERCDVQINNDNNVEVLKTELAKFLER